MDDTKEGRGTIVSVKCDGGLIRIMVKGARGKLERLIGDSGPTGRALVNLFGREVLAGPLTLDVDKIIGKEIAYGIDNLGLLAYIRDPNDEG